MIDKITIEMVNKAYDNLTHPPIWIELDYAIALHIKYLGQKELSRND